MTEAAVRGAGAPAPASPRVWIPAAALSERKEERIHILLWQVRGRTDLTVGPARMTLEAGSAFWIPVGTRHSFVVHDNSVTLPLFFDAADTATTLTAPTPISVDRDLRTLMLAYTVSSTSAITPTANISRQLLSLIETSRRAPAAPPLPQTPSARAVAAALRFNPGDTRTAEELARSAHASLRTVERAFLAETSMTLRQWRIQTRMDAAAELLRADTTVQAVAQRVGYTHVNAFRRAFKAYSGMSPTEYLSRYRRQ